MTQATLSELVGLAHFKRATMRATQAAKAMSREVWVYRTRHGFGYDIARPMVESAWRVSPQGNITQVGSGEQ